MHEPVEIALIEVLDRKGIPIKDVSLVHPVPETTGKVSDPWFPEKVLLPASLSAAFKTLFPAEYKHPGVECVLTEAIGSRHVIAIYGPEPPLRDAPKAEVEAPAPAPSAPVPVVLSVGQSVAPTPPTEG